MENVYTGQLNSLDAKIVTTETLAEAGLISNTYVRVKLIAKGDINKALAVELQGASAHAIEMLENAGGSFKSVAQVGRPAKQTDKKSDTSK